VLVHSDGTGISPLKPRRAWMGDIGALCESASVSETPRRRKNQSMMVSFGAVESWGRLRGIEVADLERGSGCRVDCDNRDRRW
jgi:hypothetical protein